MSESATSDQSLPQAGAKKKPTTKSTLVTCIALTAMLSGLLYLQVHALDAPETAMRGMKRLYAHLVCFLILAAIFIIFATMVSRRLFSRNARWLALIPALSLFPSYGFYQRAITMIKNATVVRNNYQASELDLDAFANAIASGQHPNIPLQVGRFLITDYDMLNDGRIALYTKAERNGWSRWGFIRDDNQPADSGPASLMGFTGAAGQNNQAERLNGRWFLIYDRYWLAKVGPS